MASDNYIQPLIEALPNAMDYTTTIGLLANRWGSAGPLFPDFPLRERGAIAT